LTIKAYDVHFTKELEFVLVEIRHRLIIYNLNEKNGGFLCLIIY